MNHSAYQNTVLCLRDAAEDVACRSMKIAVDETKRLYDEYEDGIANIAVSGDGILRKRGYKSSCGIVAVISVLTGKVLDFEIMSKECRTCMLNTLQEGTDEHTEWWESRKDECHANYVGSSGSMDPTGCLRIFEQSVEKYKVRYMEFLGDGDGKAHNELTQRRVYGDEQVTKQECVGHIQKRMGSRLRAMKKQMGNTKLSDGKTIGGRGRLTDKRIDSLQVYYGKAIRNNTNSIAAMQNAIMAIWKHYRSTDDDPKHELCPPGSSSWCGYQRDLARHSKEFNHDNSLPLPVAEAIRPIFENLSNEKLLEACLHGGTQNQNESFSSLNWQRATK